MSLVYVKQKLLDPPEENVEAICQLLNTVGKHLDEDQKSINDMYCQLKLLSTNPQLAPRLRHMICDILDLREKNWLPRRKEV